MTLTSPVSRKTDWYEDRWTQLPDGKYHGSWKSIDTRWGKYGKVSYYRYGTLIYSMKTVISSYLAMFTESPTDDDELTVRCSIPHLWDADYEYTATIFFTVRSAADYCSFVDSLPQFASVGDESQRVSAIGPRRSPKVRYIKIHSDAHSACEKLAELSTAATVRYPTKVSRGFVISFGDDAKSAGPYTSRLISAIRDTLRP